VKKSLISLAFVALSALVWAPAMAEENATVAAVKSANDAIGTCISAMSTGIAQSTMSSDAKVLMLRDVPTSCRNGVVVANVPQEESGLAKFYRFAGGAVALYAQYKGQALIWGGLQAMMGRQADSTDNAVNQGFNTANTSIGMVGGLASQAQGMLAAPEPAPVEPAAAPATTTP
jgi:hypothetical protein